MSENDYFISYAMCNLFSSHFHMYAKIYPTINANDVKMHSTV